MDVAVQTVNLRKSYLGRGGRRVAVQGLTMTVPAGGVHGFLGPNGSGKTTTIRMLLGLIRPDSGTAELFGRRVPRELPQVIDRVGAIVESPKFFPAFTGRQNLRLLADAIGTPRPRIDEVLEVTHLGDRGRDRYAGYSLGMKQRLAIAATLLKDPELLIFDDSIEHEALNDSDELRVVLIFDVWNPLLEPAERDMVRALSRAEREFGRTAGQ